MRFMAILSLCLVAIFALVQSIPLAPPTPETEAARKAELPNPLEAEPPRSEPEPKLETKPKPVPAQAAEPPVEVVEEKPPEVLRPASTPPCL